MQMMNASILHRRLANQHLASQPLASPHQVVQWLGAVQSQDYTGALWAVAQRAEGATTASVEAAFAEGSILRTHVMRPTWHFVPAEDIRWMLDLTRDRLSKQVAYQYRLHGLDERVFRKTDDAICQALAGGKHLTRAELVRKVAAGFEPAEPGWLTHVIIHAEIAGLICSGTPQGKQQTYALVAERVPQARTLERDEALAELARRYFRSHGPATLEDYTWWSGLTKSDAQRGLQAVASELKQETISGHVYWSAVHEVPPEQQRVYFLPNYDEYIVAYTDRSALFDQKDRVHLDSRQNPLFNNVVIMDGVMVGTWKRTLLAKSVAVEYKAFRQFTRGEQGEIRDAAERYAASLGLSCTLSVQN